MKNCMFCFQMEPFVLGFLATSDALLHTHAGATPIAGNGIGVNPPVSTRNRPFSRPCLPFTLVSRFSPVFAQNLPVISLKI